MTAGSFNSFFGVDAGEYNTMGSNNTFLGRAAGLSNSTGSNNAFTGYQAGYSNIYGDSNVFTGYQTGYSNTTGDYNVFSGTYAGYSNTTGFGNVLTGFYAGYKNTLGQYNIFSGYQAGYSNTTGNYNVFSGISSGYYNTSGSNNIIIGPFSGTAIITSDDNVLMGYNSQADDGLQNAIAIGANSRVAVSNALILGNQVNVGIGTSSPKSKLEVVADEADASGLRLSNMTTSSPVTQATDQFLTVNEKGDVVKARYQLRINATNEWSDKVFAPTYQLRPLTSVASYISQYGHLPGIPSAEQVVKEGVDLVKINATLLEKVEELTLYSIQQDKKIQQQSEELQAIKQLLQQVLNRK